MRRRHRARRAGKQTLVAVLSGGSEAPTVVNTGAHGKAVITIDPDSGEVTWVIDVFNFPTGLTASHIHVGAAGTAGPVIIDFAPTDLGVSGPFRLSGSTRNFIARPAQGIRSMEEAMIAIAAGNAYVNVHSQANPGGEIRGQLCPDEGQRQPVHRHRALLARPAVARLAAALPQRAVAGHPLSARSVRAARSLAFTGCYPANL